MRRGVMVPEQMGNPSGGDGGVVLISATEIAKRLPLFGMGKPNVHPHQQREHDQRQDGGPLKEESEHDGDESDVLRMPHVGIDAGGRELMLALCPVEYGPGGGEENESSNDQQVAQDMQDAGVRV